MKKPKKRKPLVVWVAIPPKLSARNHCAAIGLAFKLKRTCANDQTWARGDGYGYKPTKFVEAK